MSHTLRQKPIIDTEFRCNGQTLGPLSSTRTEQPPLRADHRVLAAGVGRLGIAITKLQTLDSGVVS
jgi:hypothetical protein